MCEPVLFQRQFEGLNRQKTSFAAVFLAGQSQLFLLRCGRNDWIVPFEQHGQNVYKKMSLLSS